MAGLVQGTGNSLVEGSSFGTALKQGLFDAAIGGVTGGISAGLTSGIQSVAEGGNFWKGSYPGIPHGPVPDLDSYLSSTDSQGNYYGYYGYEYGTDNVRYVGITNRDPEIRFNEHWRSGTNRSSLEYQTIERNMTKINARIWEQLQINKYGMIKNGGQLYNLRNEINRKYWLKYGIN